MNLKVRLTKFFYALLALCFSIASCTDISETPQTNEEVTAEELAEEHAREWAEFIGQEHGDERKFEKSVATGRLPLEERKRIAQRYGISDEEAGRITEELTEFAEKIGFLPDEISVMFDTPYFFIDGDGELVDIREIKAGMSYAMYTRKFYHPFDERVRALYEEYSAHFGSETTSSEQQEQLYREYKEKLEKIRAEVEETKRNAAFEPGPWLFVTHEPPASG